MNNDVDNDTDTSFPESISIKALNKKSKEYQDTSKQDDFYNAGSSFPADKYLRFREMEKRGANQNKRKARVNAATLEPVLSGVVDFLVGATIKSKVSILAQEDSEYYNKLNTLIGSTQRELLKKGILHNRSYALISFPTSGITFNLEQQKKSGGLDASISVIPAHTVIDWKEDLECNLVFAKTYSTYSERSNEEAIWEAHDIQVHEWTFFTADSTATYQFVSNIVDGTPEPLDDDALASRIEIVPHSLGACPLICFNPSSKIIDRILPIADAHFQRTSSITFSLDTTAWSIPVICTKKPIQEVYSDETSAMILDPGDTASSFGPNSNQNFAALSENAEYLAMQLFKVIQAASLNSYQTGQNTSRLSAAARKHEASYIEILLASYADDLLACYSKVVKLIQFARGDSQEITISGVDDFNSETLNNWVDTVTKLLGLDIGTDAKQYLLGTIANLAVSDAPADIRIKVAKAAQATKEEKNIDKTIEINGAVSQGLVQLIGAGLMTEAEARIKIGLPPDMIKQDKKITQAYSEISDSNNNAID